MTEAEIEELKKQIKTELLEEMQGGMKKMHLSPWEEIKSLILLKLVWLNTYELYQVVNSISTLLRYTFGISQIRNLSRDELDTATKIVNGFLDHMKRKKVG